MPDFFEPQAFSPLIVLDLEWNQRYGRQQGIPSSLPQEIVEIGAVKLDASMRIVGQFQATVRPVVHPVLHRHVQRVTGISAEDCREGLPFRQAGEALMAFCGDRFTLCTWGPDDYPVLQRNLAFWMLPQERMPRPIDAQRMYAHLQCAGKSQQVGLQAAMEALDIAPEFPSHRALHDAYHTALVIGRLRAAASALPEGDPRLRALRTAGMEHRQRLQEHSAVLPTPHRTPEALLADEALFAITCPRCGGPLRSASGRFCAPDKCTFEQYAACERHGSIYARFVPQRTVTGTLSLRVCASVATEQQMRQFVERCARQSALRKRRRQHRGGKSRAAGGEKR